MKEGKITKVVIDKGFFFIDTDFWCHINQYTDNNPEIGDTVEYEPETRPDGKKSASKARLVMKRLDDNTIQNSIQTQVSESNEITKYLNEFKKGYFKEVMHSDNSFYLKKEFIIDLPQKLAKYFTRNPNINKSSQIRKFFDQCKIIESKYKISNDFNCAISELLQIVPLANSAKEKKHISPEFFQFLEININEATKSKENFLKGFIPHFQSIIGYF